MQPGPAGTYFLAYAHVEGHAFLGRDPREYCVRPLEVLSDRDGHVRAVRVERTVWETGPGGTPGHRPTRSVEEIPAELMLLAVGFTSHDAPAIVRELGLRTVQGRVPAQSGGHATDAPGVFVAGDMRRGASLVVWAMAEGRAAAAEVTRLLAGASRARPQLRRDATPPREL
jgi:NADPH-dependent glutamate synthase beta subunit-like oxidoreductase